MADNIGRYRILEPLGRGAMGEVYLAEDPKLNRRVAIKMVSVSAEDSSQKEFLTSRLVKDAKAAAALSHPNIVGVYDILELDGGAYIVMEYISGTTLSARLRAQPAPPLKFGLSVLRQVAAALDYTHSRHVIHRDIKPANIMIDDSGNAKILDFGIARISDSQTTQAGLIMGTVEYMAPEQIKGADLDGRADQYSLGVIAYQMMTGSTLFESQSFATLAYRLINDTPAQASSRNASLPKLVDPVLAKAISKLPAQRFANCTEFVKALESVFQPAPPPAPLVTKSAQPGISKWIVAGVVAILGAAGLSIWHPWTKGNPDSVVTPPQSTAQQSQPLTPKPDPEIHTKAKSQVVQKAKAVSTEPNIDSSKLVVPPQPPQLDKDESSNPDAQEGSVTPVVAHPFREGVQQFNSGRYEEAIQSFTAVLAKGNFAHAFHNRGMAYLRLERFDAAIKDFTDAIRMAPRDSFSYADRGSCFVRQKRDDLALDDFNRAIAIKADSPAALMGRGGIYLRRKQYDQAMRDLDAAIQMRPKMRNAYVYRSQVRKASGDLEGARADTQMARQLAHPKQ